MPLTNHRVPSVALRPPPPARSRRAWAILGMVVSAGVIYWLAVTLDLRQVLSALKGIHAGWVAAGMLAVFLTMGARALRWHALLGLSYATRQETLRVLVLGQVLNLILPARLGDLARVYLIARAGCPSQAQALGSVALEKLLDVLLLVALALLLSFWHPLPAWITVPARVTALLSGILLAGLLALLLLRRHLVAAGDRLWRLIGLAGGRPGAALGWLCRHSARFLDALDALRNRRILVAAAGWSLIVWLLGALTNLILLKAFAMPASMGVALLLLVVVQTGVAVPSLPGRIGVFEGLCLAVLTLFQVDAPLAVSYGLVLHAVVLLPPLALGLWWLLRLDAAARRTIWRPP